MTLGKKDIAILESVYWSTDCSNGVYDAGTLHHMRHKRANTLVDLGLLRRFDDCVPVDGDGFALPRHREGYGWQLTNAGYEALTDFSPGRFPADDEHRRFYVRDGVKC
jgi:hypothetical protein